MSETTSVVERRQSLRHKLSLPWTVSTTMSGQRIKAEMVDVSIHGAKIRLPEQVSQQMLVPGAELVLNITMPSGREASVSICPRWVHRFPEGYIIGVSFVDNGMIAEELSRLRQVQV